MYKVNESLKEIEIQNEKSNRSFVFLLLIFAILFSVIIYLNGNVFFNVIVSGDSMCDTLTSGDYLIGDRKKKIERGDVVIVDGKKEVLGKDGKVNYEWLIKRVIAVEGDEIDIDNNGYVLLKKAGEDEFVILDEPYVKEQGKTNLNITSEVREMLPYTLKENEVFFLGDNRAVSRDSRYYKTCTEDDIVGVIPEWSIKIKGFNNWYVDKLVFINNLFR